MDVSSLYCLDASWYLMVLSALGWYLLVLSTLVLQLYPRCTAWSLSRTSTADVSSLYCTDAGWYLGVLSALGWYLVVFSAISWSLVVLLALAVTRLGQCLTVVISFGSGSSLAVTQFRQCLAAVVVAFDSVSSLTVTLLGQGLAAAWLWVAGTVKVVVDGVAFGGEWVPGFATSLRFQLVTIVTKQSLTSPNLYS